MKKFGDPYDSLFFPMFSPKEMLQLGIFQGEYFRGKKGQKAMKEFPSSWFKTMKKENYFNIKASLSRAWWSNKMHPDDPLGWFQWYCRFYQGRRHPDDYRQIMRWRNFINRHHSMFRYCVDRVGGSIKDELLYPKHRQAMLHWSWDASFKPKFKTNLTKRLELKTLCENL